jgi:hypothetical protein
MHLISLLDHNARAMTPGTGGVYSPTDHVAAPSSWILLANISRPGKLPRGRPAVAHAPATGDTITLRDLATNKLLAIRGTGGRSHLARTELQTDHQAADFDALIEVVSVTDRGGGFSNWHLVAKSDPTLILDVMVWDHSLGSRVGAAGGEVHVVGNLLRSAAGPGAVVTFHPIPASDLGDLYTDLEIWLSVDGRPVSVGSDLELHVGSLPATPATRWHGSVFRVARIGTPGLVRARDQFRLIAVDTHVAGSTAPALVVRDGVLRVAAVAENDPSAAFTLSQLVSLDQYWNPTTQDNAILTGPAAGYTFVRSEGEVFVRPRTGTVPIKQFFSRSRGDTMTTATVAGQEAALAGDYVYRSIIGWAYDRPQPTTRIARQYWHGGRGDNMLTATQAGEGSCGAYSLAYDDCYVLPPFNIAAAVASHAGLLGPVVLLPGAGGHTPSPQAPAIDPAVAAAGTHSKSPVPEGFVPGPLRRPVRALVLGGGGAKGAFEAGAIREIWRKDAFDIVCGVSVGAVNAVKVAENHEHVGDQLVSLWRSFSAGPSAIFLKEMYLEVIKRAVDALGGAAKDVGIATLIGRIAAEVVLPFAALVDVGVAVASGLIATETTHLSDQMRRLINLATLFHGLHCMDPLRRLLHQQIDPATIMANKMKLRLGITDPKSGCFFTVTEPFAGASLAAYGAVEVEPDMTEGGNWLTQPVFDCKHYAMKLEDAVYASSTMPVYMDPLEIHLAHTQLRDVPGIGRVGLLDVGLPPGVSELLSVVVPGEAFRSSHLMERPEMQQMIDRYSAAHGLPADATERAAELRKRARLAEDHNRGTSSVQRTLFDGGLVDSLPIRTAMRLGATEIVVMGVDQLYSGGAEISRTNPITQYSWFENLLNGAGLFGGVDAMTLPLVQYLFGTIGGFVLETTRGDMLSSLGVVDTRRIANAASAQMTAEQRTRWRAAVDGVGHAPARRSLLGGTTSLGGWTADAYGEGSTNGVAIDLILPDRPLLDSLGFGDAPGVNEAIELGRLAAKNPVAI